MNKQTIKNIEDNLVITDAHLVFNEFDYLTLTEELQIERIVNLCNSVDWSEAEQNVIYDLYDNYLDLMELVSDINFFEKEFSDAKLLYVCHTGKAYLSEYKC